MPQQKKSTKTNSPIVGVDWMGPKPFAFCGEQKWDIKQLAHVKPTLDKIMQIMDDHDKLVNKLGANPPIYQLHKISEGTARSVLELSLLKFDYDKVATNPESPPGLLGILAGEVRDFLSVGGARGMQHVQMRLNLARQT